MITPADHTEEALSSMAFFGPFAAIFAVVCMAVACFRWLRFLGRQFQ